MQDSYSALKILQFCDNFYPQIDGVIKVVDNTTRVMNERCTAKAVVPKYRFQEYDDSVFPYEVWRKEVNSVNFNGLEVPFPKKTSDFTRRVNGYAADIYHIHSPFFLGKYALRLAKDNDIPVIATFHSQFKKDILSLSHSRVLTEVMLKNIVGVFNQCTEVWAPSRSTASILQSYGYKKEIFIMENGTDFVYPPRLNEVADGVRKKYGILPEHKNLLFVGQMRDVKNIPLILRTFKGLAETDESYRLFLVGEGFDREKYEKWTASNGLCEKIRFLGKISDRTELAGVYAVCDLFFFPSVYDNAPIVVREACVMRTPVLLPRGAVAAEPFTDGVNGYLAGATEREMQEKIMSAFQNPDAMRRVGERASRGNPDRVRGDDGKNVGTI